jgi:hypothetical protein
MLVVDDLLKPKFKTVVHSSIRVLCNCWCSSIPSSRNVSGRFIFVPRGHTLVYFKWITCINTNLLCGIVHMFLYVICGLCTLSKSNLSGHYTQSVRRHLSVWLLLQFDGSYFPFCIRMMSGCMSPSFFDVVLLTTHTRVLVWVLLLIDKTCSQYRLIGITVCNFTSRQNTMWLRFIHCDMFRFIAFIRLLAFLYMSEVLIYLLAFRLFMCLCLIVCPSHMRIHQFVQCTIDHLRYCAPCNCGKQLVCHINYTCNGRSSSIYARCAHPQVWHFRELLFCFIKYHS